MKQCQKIKENCTGEISVFTSFLTSSTKVLNLQGRLCTRLCFRPFFEIFLIFPNILRSKVSRCLASCEATRMQCFSY